MMGQFEQLDQMLTAQEGMLRTSQVVSSGISKPVFYDYVRSRDLDRAAQGIYLSKDSWVDATIKEANVNVEYIKNLISSIVTVPINEGVNENLLYRPQTI